MRNRRIKADYKGNQHRRLSIIGRTVSFRYANNLTGDFSCMLSNQLQQAFNPPPPLTRWGSQDSIFTAEVGSVSVR